MLRLYAPDGTTLLGENTVRGGVKARILLWTSPSLTAAGTSSRYRSSHRPAVARPTGTSCPSRGRVERIVAHRRLRYTHRARLNQCPRVSGRRTLGISTPSPGSPATLSSPTSIQPFSIPCSLQPRWSSLCTESEHDAHQGRGRFYGRRPRGPWCSEAALPVDGTYYLKARELRGYVGTFNTYYQLSVRTGPSAFRQTPLPRAHRLSFRGR